MAVHCKNEEAKSIKIFHGKEKWYLNNDSSCVLNAVQSLRKKNPKIAETPKITGKVETSKINRERRNTITVTLAADVTNNITHTNRQQTNHQTDKKMAYTTKI